MIRPAATSDAPTIARLLDELGYPASAVDVLPRLARLMAGAATIAVVAEHEGEVVGLATGQTFATIHVDGDVAWLTSLVVATPARRLGVGRQLVNAVEAWAQSRDCSRISVATALHRAGAHAFYERLGYHFTGRRYATLLPRVQP